WRGPGPSAARRLESAALSRIGGACSGALAAYDDPPMTTAVVAISNQKGGVGKSTTAVNLAAALAGLGRRILVVDMDPQGNATSGLGIDRTALDHTIYDVLLKDVDLADAVEPTSTSGVFVGPATIELAAAEIELVSTM